MIEIALMDEEVGHRTLQWVLDAWKDYTDTGRRRKGNEDVKEHSQQTDKQTNTSQTSATKKNNHYKNQQEVQVSHIMDLY